MPEEYKTLQGGPMCPRLPKVLGDLVNTGVLTRWEAVTIMACVHFAATKPAIFSANGGGDSYIETAQGLIK